MLPFIMTVILSLILIPLVYAIGYIAIIVVTVSAGGWMWTKPAAWAYPVDLIILIATFLFNVFIVISVYRFLVKLFSRNTSVEIIPKYIYGIAILLPIVIPIVAYFAYTYSIYHYETEMPETCLVNGLTYLKETDKCKQLDDPSYIEPNPSEL